MLTKQLEKLNLNNKEATVYLSLLELGETTIQRIANKSKIKRTTVYDTIDSLREKGLVASTKKNKKTLYYAEDPRLIKDKIAEQEQTLNKILPELLSITNLIDKKPKIQFFEGEEGIKNVYKDTLKYPRQEILMWGAPEMFEYFDMDFMWNYYQPKRIEKRIWMRAIGPDDKIVNAIKENDEKSLRKTKLAPTDQFPLEVEINLYGKRFIGIMSFKEKIGLIIESEKIYKTLKSIFEMNWQMLK
jgi:sugar-specific transcriptional regulator TrmB